MAFGSPVLDVIVQTEAIPGWDAKAPGKFIGMFAGGTAANVASMGSLLGLRCACFGEIGDDAGAAILVDEFKGAGVSTHRLKIVRGRTSALAHVCLSPSGERAIIFCPQSPTPRGDVIDALAESTAAYLMPSDVTELEQIYRQSRQTETLVAIDLEAQNVRTESTFLQFLARSDIAFMNEGGFLAGMSCSPSLGLLNELRRACDLQAIVVTLGAEGAMCAVGDEAVQQAARKVEKVIDTTGAGDTFNAAFLTSFIRGGSASTCLDVGLEVASKTIQVHGARPPASMLTGLALPSEFTRS